MEHAAGSYFLILMHLVIMQGTLLNLQYIYFQNTDYCKDIIPVESYIDVIQRAHISQLSGTQKILKFLAQESFITLILRHESHSDETRHSYK